MLFRLIPLGKRKEKQLPLFSSLSIWKQHTLKNSPDFLYFSIIPLQFYKPKPLPFSWRTVEELTPIC